VSVTASALDWLLDSDEPGIVSQAKRDLRKSLARLETGAHGSGEPSRWTAGRELEWVELCPELENRLTMTP